MLFKTERANIHRLCRFVVNGPEKKNDEGYMTGTATATGRSETFSSSTEALIEVTRSLRDRFEVRFRGPRERLRDFNGGRIESFLYRDMIPAIKRTR